MQITPARITLESARDYQAIGFITEEELKNYEEQLSKNNL